MGRMGGYGGGAAAFLGQGFDGLDGLRMGR